LLLFFMFFTQHTTPALCYGERELAVVTLNARLLASYFHLFVCHFNSVGCVLCVFLCFSFFQCRYKQYCDMTPERLKCAVRNAQQRRLLLDKFPSVTLSTRIHVCCWAAVLFATVLQACPGQRRREQKRRCSIFGPHEVSSVRDSDSQVEFERERERESSRGLRIEDGEINS
jgi:hypothetical protein